MNNVLQTQDVRDYVNGVEYKGGIVDRFSHTEGAVVWQTNSFQHEYTIKDHLGNARVTYSDGNNDGVITVADIKQINHYYPFGMNMEGNWNGAAGSNKYGFNGKEWNDDFGLGWNHHDWRFLDVAINRWVTVDPECESDNQIHLSPYHFSYGNPIRYSDPDGMEGEECCGTPQELTAGLVGVTVGVVDNLLGSNLREEVGNKMFGNGGLRDNFNAGLDVADKGSLVAGATMVVGGGVIAGGGAAVSTTGVGAIAGVPTIAVGLGTSAAGTFVFRNAAKNLQNSQVKANSHGNKLDDKPSERYTLRDRKTGEVKKHGETTRGEDKNGVGNQKRYSKKFLKENDVDYKKENSGTKKQMHREQHEKILEHKKNNNGKRPDMNKSDY